MWLLYKYDTATENVWDRLCQTSDSLEKPPNYQQANFGKAVAVLFFSVV